MALTPFGFLLRRLLAWLILLAAQRRAAFLAITLGDQPGRLSEALCQRHLAAGSSPRPIPSWRAWLAQVPRRHRRARCRHRR